MSALRTLSRREGHRRRYVVAASDVITGARLVDAVVQPDELRSELIQRLELARGKDRRFSERHNPVTPT